MRRGAAVLAVGISGWALVTVAGGKALADSTKDQCVDANTQAQTLRRAGQLGAAREQLVLCGDARCPGVVRDDCAQRLDELERAQPTLVLDVQDASGQDIVTVDVRIDGKPFADRLDGRAIVVDPGEHTFTFSVPGLGPVTRRLVLKEGEKERRERVVVGEPAPRETTPAVIPSPVTRHSGHTQRVAGIVLTGVGVVGIAIGAVFGVMTIDDWSHSKSECASSTSCTSLGFARATADRQSAFRAATVSNVGFIAGGAVLATGIALWLTAPSSTDDATTAVRIAPSLGPGLAGLAVAGGF